MSIRYAPGPAFALVRPGLAVLVDASIGTAVAAELWTAVHAADISARELGQRDLATLLDAVTEVLDPTWRALPAFAIALVHAEEGVAAAAAAGDGPETGREGRWAAQIAVRGDFAATVTTPTSTERISGPAVTTWVDKRIGDVVHVELVAGGGADGDIVADGTEAPVLCIADGVVPAGALSWDLRECVGAPAESSSARAVLSFSGPQDLLQGTGAGDETSAVTLEKPSNPGKPAVPVPDLAADVDSGDDADSIHQIESDFARTRASFPDEWDDDASVEPGDQEEPADRDDRDANRGGLDHEDDDTLDAVSSLSALRPLVSVASVASLAAVSAVSALDSPETLETLQTIDQRDARVAPAEVDDDFDDFDDTTVFASAIAQIKSAGQPGPIPPPPPPPPLEPLPEPSRQGTEVLARSCFFSHANPPARSTCAQCGGGLSPTAQLVERPSLGRVEVSTGESVDLSVPVVVGRFPQAQATASPVAQRLVTVPSPNQDISRSHLEIRLDGWHVLLVDLDTVNGTTLLRAGQPPRRLHPSEPTLVAVGDVVDLGDGVTLSFRELI